VPTHGPFNHASINDVGGRRASGEVADGASLAIVESLYVAPGQRKLLSELEPPIGIEPMTYALREGCNSSRHVHQVTPTLLAGFRLPFPSTVIQRCC
jgi:hypothetical protein